MLVLLGATGRIGRIVASAAAKANFPIGRVDRTGVVSVEGAACGNIWDPKFSLGCQVHFADCSIDYSSLENMASFENRKRALVLNLAERGILTSFLTISSGAVEFDDRLIQSNFHLEYKRQKLATESLAKMLGDRAYCPRVYTLIGPETFKVKSVGWVNVVAQCLAGERVTIDVRNEPRSWVAEKILSGRIAEWLLGQSQPTVETPTSGVFYMSQLIDYMAVRLKRHIEAAAIPMAGWLTVPYVASGVSDPVSLEKTVDLCLARHKLNS